MTLRHLKSRHGEARDVPCLRPAAAALHRGARDGARDQIGASSSRRWRRCGTGHRRPADRSPPKTGATNEACGADVDGCDVLPPMEPARLAQERREGQGHAADGGPIQLLNTFIDFTLRT